MEEELEHDDAGAPDEWAVSTASSLALAETVSRWLFVGAALALSFGAISAIATFLTFNESQSLGDFASMSSNGSSIAVSQMASTLLSSLLPAGVFAAAAVALRLQAARFAADVLGR